MPKVSVIIPVYGVEKYIERCARSLFEQTLDDIEYIFIDDCSPDNSIQVLKTVIEDYPQRKDSIRIERMQTNSGLPTVRKRGVELASGEFFIACDSDDWVEKTMYEEMYDLAVKGNYDLVQCDIDVVNESQIIYSHSSKKENLSSDELRQLIIEGRIANSLCNKLVSKSIYHNGKLVFPEASMDEDNAMAVQLAFYAQNLGYIKKPFYKAYQNTDSISRVPGEQQVLKRYEGALKNSNLIVDFLNRNGYASSEVSVVTAKLRPKLYLWSLLHKKNCKELWNRTYPEIAFLNVLLTDLPWRIKLKVFLVETGFIKIIRMLKQS